jgi:hypothetical protein
LIALALLSLEAWMPLVLTVDRLWDGSAAAPDEMVTVALRDGGPYLIVEVDAPFHGDPAPPSPPGTLWGLWDHEVVELFISGFGDPVPYFELELGPYGHHLAIQLRGLRNVVARCLPLRVEASIDGDRWRATAWVPREYLPMGPHRANAYTIHGPAADRRYLAWTPVPGAVPDFHRLERFAPVVLP